ncbi:hypothetical protein [Marinifilum sp.]|uniref:hypothetical protein n=1 Tax=Marinifilum sp. TaxID=2033137 RepID=UPI003BA9BCC3
MVCTLFAVSTIVGLIIRKLKYVYVTLLVFTIVFSVSIYFLLRIKPEIRVIDFNEYDSFWESDKDHFTTEFVVIKNLIYLKVILNGEEGLYIFYTGATPSGVNELLVNKDKDSLIQINITDANKVRQSQGLLRVDSFKLGSIKIKNLWVVALDSLV